MPDPAPDLEQAIRDAASQPAKASVDSGLLRAPIDDLSAYDTFAASAVVHYFRSDRPGQLRGIPDIMTCPHFLYQLL